jgi:hypothetical protein
MLKENSNLTASNIKYSSGNIFNSTIANTYSSGPVSLGNTFQELPQLQKMADNTESCICVTYINTVKFN